MSPYITIIIFAIVSDIMAKVPSVNYHTNITELKNNRLINREERRNGKRNKKGKSQFHT